jgi:hypothetical protein
MAQFLASAICLPLIFVTWGLLFNVMVHGIPILGETNQFDWIIFLGPIIGFGLPASAVAFFKVGAAGGMLCVALAPLLAPLNFWIATSISSSCNLSHRLIAYTLLASWFVPFPLFWGAALVRNSRAT